MTVPVRAYLIEILVLDFENTAPAVLKEKIENARQALPSILSMKMRELSPWSDDHPLNRLETRDEELKRLFGRPLPVKPIPRIKSGG